MLRCMHVSVVVEAWEGSVDVLCIVRHRSRRLEAGPEASWVSAVSGRAGAVVLVVAVDG